MKYSRRVEIFEQVRARYTGFLASVLWKLTGDKELFAEAMQYALSGIRQHIEKLKTKKAAAYVYRIALTANSKAWRNRIGRDGQITKAPAGIEKDPPDTVGKSEVAQIVRRAITQLPARQGRAIVMRYLEQKDYKGIAEKLCCTEAGARSNVSKALATLKDKLSGLTERAE